MEYRVRNINSLTEEEITYIKEKYPNRYEKTMALSSVKDQKRGLLAYIILISLIGDFDENDVYYNDLGKPYIKNKPQFSYSHSENLVACAIDENEIGLDIQVIKDSSLRLFRLFTIEEQHMINDASVPVNELTRLWSIKESTMKCLGKGVTLPFNAVKIIDESKVECEGKILTYQIFETDSNYKLCITK